MTKRKLKRSGKKINENQEKRKKNRKAGSKRPRILGGKEHGSEKK
jgi:hypothetical protein